MAWILDVDDNAAENHFDTLQLHKENPLSDHHQNCGQSRGSVAIGGPVLNGKLTF